MLRIKDLSLGSKMLLIVLTLILTVVYFAYQEIKDGLNELRESKNLYHEVNLSEVLSDVIHEIQRERGLSVLYVSSSRVKLKIELLEQQNIVDSKIKNFQTLIENEASFSNINTLFNSFQIKREAVMNFSDSPANIAEYFANVTHELLAYMELLRSNIKDTGLKNKLKVHINLLYAKEYLALIRSILNEDLSRDGTTIQNYSRFALSKGKYDFNVMRLRNSSETELVEYYENKMDSTAARIVHDTIEKIFRFNSIEKTPLAYAEWWRLSSETIDLYHDVEIHSLELIKTHVQERIIILESKVKNIIFSIVFIILLLTIVTLLFIRYISRNIIEIQNAAKKLARGDINVNLDLDTRDEMGNLAASFRSIIGFTKEYSRLADEIGKGNYNVPINIKSDKDILGKSLVTMRNNLKNLKEKESNQLWKNNGLNEVSKIVREEQNVESLAGNTLNFLVRYLNAQVGTFYILTDDGDEGPVLRLKAAYAFNRLNSPYSEIRLGQGLVGQSALEKKSLLLSNLPEDYVKVSSSIGETAPVNTITIPLTSNGNLKGVLELASNEEYSQGKMEFIEELAENLGISIEILQRKLQTERLLKEANQLSDELKKQTEELAEQQEELRQTNEALFNQTQRLQASEEKLRLQQDELEKANDELEEKASQLEEKNNIVERKNKELEIAKEEISIKAEELEMSSRFKSEFLANMSHELRTPLNSILILAKLLADDHEGNLSAKQKEFASVIHKSGNDLLRLINDVLDLSKIESGKTEFEFEAVNISEICDDMAKFFGEMAGIKEINFSIDKDITCPSEIFTDRLKLEQIIKNLLSNSFKFTDKGGQVNVMFSGKKNNDEFRDFIKSPEVLEISVTDTGIGIPEEKQKIIFDAFQQADGSTNRRFGGTGLGLSISRKLAILLGGDIRLKSEPGKGSTFYIYLPVKKLNEEQEPDHTPEEIKVKSLEKKKGPGYVNGRGNGGTEKRILIIDDDTEFAGTIQEFTRKKGYQAIIAGNCEKGLQCARELKPDAIILNMNQPLINGWNVLKEIKTDKDLMRIPVHVMTGTAKTQQPADITELTFLPKQVSVNDLESTFDKINREISQKIRKVLVIEDNKNQNDAIKFLISKEKLVSLSAFTGEEAFEVLSKEYIDCIILDLGLPDIDGMQMLKKLKTDERYAYIPVIIFTGRNLSNEEIKKINSYQGSTVILKTAYSNQRLLEETELFLNQMETARVKEIIYYRDSDEHILKDKKVLIVDDDMRNVFALKNVLEEKEMIIKIAGSGTEALEVLDNTPGLDVVLMDIMLPEMDGYEAIQIIRKNKKFSDLPVIALTAKAMKGDREKILEAGASDYISKPVDLDNLISLLKAWLDK